MRQTLNFVKAMDRVTRLVIEAGDPIRRAQSGRQPCLSCRQGSLLREAPQQTMDGRNIGGMAPGPCPISVRNGITHSPHGRIKQDRCAKTRIETGPVPSEMIIIFGKRCSGSKGVGDSSSCCPENQRGAPKEFNNGNNRKKVPIDRVQM
jgi:hypothetical protein